MGLFADIVGFFTGGTGGGGLLGEGIERLVRREELEFAIDSALTSMQSSAGNDGQFIILTEYVPGPFRRYFMQEGQDYGPDFGSYESAMRSSIGDEKYEAVYIILEIGFEEVSSVFW